MFRVKDLKGKRRGRTGRIDVFNVLQKKDKKSVNLRVDEVAEGCTGK